VKINNYIDIKTIKHKPLKLSIMKNTIKLLAVLLIAFTFNSCDEVNDLADISIETSLTEQIDVQITEDQDQVSDQIVLSIDNSDTHDYLDKLKSISIEKLTYKFIGFSGNDTCNMSVDISTDGNVLDTKTFQIKQESDNGTIYEITDVAKLNAMATALKNNQQVSFEMDGTVSDGPANFKIEVTATIKIVANPL